MALARSYAVLILGRVVTGFGVGTGLTVAPHYMAELSPKGVRGALVSLNEVSINIGLVLGFVAGWAFSGLGPDKNWRWMLGMGCLPPFFILIGLVFMPESPRWLIKADRAGEAHRVLMAVCGREEGEATMKELEEERRLRAIAKPHWRDLFRKEEGRRSLIIAGMLMAIFQQASGLEALVRCWLWEKREIERRAREGGRKRETREREHGLKALCCVW